ncbi:MAG TPA: hypothetical protein VHM19_10320 [Polyangiales bacterium]|jgi:mono/diheme cytochrome c family protein|nr:hypothetical protein [Polyangiales bacterium]
MKTALKIVVSFIGLLLVSISVFVIYCLATYRHDYSSVELPNIHASKDPAVIAQGEYLANAVAHCPACHEPSYYVRRRTLTANLSDLRGGFVFHAGPFGTFHAANLTSDPATGIGNVSDAQLARAIRHGVDRHGRYAAFMAFSVGNMADEDLTALVSYLRTLPPKSNPVPADEWGIVAKLMASKFVPHDEPKMKYVPEGGVSVERGEYLANGPAGCYNCHTRRDPMNGFAMVGARLSGNNDADPDETEPGFEIAAPNLTSDPETGRTGAWTEDQFVSRLRAGRTVAGSHMPWENFARMTEDDLRSLYRYLHSLPPVKNDVGPTRRRAGWKKT